MNEHSFSKELSQLFNKYSIDNKTNTPDFVLADYVENCIAALTLANKKNKMSLEEARGLAAWAWCDEKNSHKVLDPDLAESFAKILLKVCNL